MLNPAMLNPILQALTAAANNVPIYTRRNSRGNIPHRDGIPCGTAPRPAENLACPLAKSGGRVYAISNSIWNLRQMPGQPAGARDAVSL